MTLQGIWIRRDLYRVINTTNGEMLDHFIAATEEEYRDPGTMQELACFATEESYKHLKVKNEKPALALQKSFRLDLGRTLMEIKESKRRRKIVGHGRWW